MPDDFRAKRLAAFRMGTLRYQATGWAAHACVPSAIRRLRNYAETGNRECLVDAYNLIVIEWLVPNQEGTIWTGSLAAPEPYQLSVPEGAVARLWTYLVAGLREDLVDSAGAILAEWHYPNRETHYAAVDDGEHVEML
jgi:hypothetical protein